MTGIAFRRAGPWHLTSKNVAKLKEKASDGQHYHDTRDCTGEKSAFTFKTHRFDYAFTGVAKFHYDRDVKGNSRKV